MIMSTLASHPGSTRVLDRTLSDLQPGLVLTIQEAATRLRTTPRMLRYREAVGLLPTDRAPGAHRRYDDRALRAASYAIALERAYDVSPAALAFALRALTEPAVYEDVRRLGELAGQGRRSALAALDFEQEKARRLLSRNSVLPRA
jgi:MerR family copper efflux transcriptional regulator